MRKARRMLRRFRLKTQFLALMLFRGLSAPRPLLLKKILFARPARTACPRGLCQIILNGSSSFALGDLIRHIGRFQGAWWRLLQGNAITLGDAFDPDIKARRDFHREGARGEVPPAGCNGEVGSVLAVDSRCGAATALGLFCFHVNEKSVPDFAPQRNVYM